MSVPWPGVFQTQWRAPIHSFLTCAPAILILKASTILCARNMPVDRTRPVSSPARCAVVETNQ